MTRLIPLLLCACTPNTDTVVVPFGPDDFLRVVIHQTNGEVAVRRAETSKVEGALSWAGDTPPVVRTRLAGETLLIFAECPTGTRRCSIDLDVSVPETTDVDVQSAEGGVLVEGVAGVVALDVAVGAVTLKDVTGNTRVNLVEGDLGLDAVVGRLDLSIGTGDVDGTALSAPTFSMTAEKGGANLIFTDQPDILTLSTQRGDLNLQLPRGDYEITANAPRGDISILGVVNTVDAGSLVDLYTRRGSISIKGN